MAVSFPSGVPVPPTVSRAASEPNHSARRAASFRLEETLGRAVRRLASMRELPAASAMFLDLWKLVANEGRPFAATGYDFDSLENRDPRIVDRVLQGIAEPLSRYLKAEVRGMEHTDRGRVLYVGNHNGGASAPEIFLFGRALHQRHGLDGLPYGLAHELVGRVPPLSRALIPLGAVRASHQNAARLYERGKSVLVYPGGDEDALRPSARRDEIVFGERRGYIRLALRHGVPIVPVVAAGAHDVFFVLHDGQAVARWLKLDRLLRMKVFPVILSVPWGVTVGLPIPFIPLPARVLMEVLPPIHFERGGERAARDGAYVEQCHARVVREMQACLTRLATELRAR